MKETEIKGAVNLGRFGTTFAQLTVQCPFYKFERGGKVYCEGGQIKFMSNTHRKEFLREHCGSLERWPECCLAMELNKEYDRRDKNENGRI